MPLQAAMPVQGAIPAQAAVPVHFQVRRAASQVKVCQKTGVDNHETRFSICARPGAALGRVAAGRARSAGSRSAGRARSTARG